MNRNDKIYWVIVIILGLFGQAFVNMKTVNWSGKLYGMSIKREARTAVGMCTELPDQNGVCACLPLPEALQKTAIEKATSDACVYLREDK